MSRSNLRLFALTITTALACTGWSDLSHAANGALRASDNGFDFGHAGIDFKLFHTFVLRNEGQKDITLRSANVPCECTSVQISDTLLTPGESTKVRVTLDTYSLFGPSSKQFSIQTNDPGMPKFEYPYFATVGQWSQGLRPDPINLFFLPGHPAKKISIPNHAFDNVNMTLVDQADTVYAVSITKSTARKGEKVELEVAPKQDLGPGTYLSSFRVRLELPSGNNPMLLNIPVKIVRY